jgi:hypothetical protein
MKIAPDSFLSSHEVGKLIGYNTSSINKWADAGKIVNHRSPGGHRRMRPSDVVAFLQAFEMPVPDALARFGKKRRKKAAIKKPRATRRGRS